MKTIKTLLIVLAVLFAFTSCELQDDNADDAADLTTGARIVGWASPTVTESYFEDFGVIDKEYPINVLGGSDGSPTTADIAFSVTVNAAETTAVNGEYVLNATSALIPAGGTFGLLPLGVNTTNFSPTSPTKLVLDLETSVNNVVVSSLARQMTINFVGCQSELANFTYLVTTTREDNGATYGPVVETMLMESVNSFMSYGVGLWDPQLNAGHGVRFNDICGDLTIPDQQLADMYPNAVKGLRNGTVDEDGNFTLDYSIAFPSGTNNYSATYIKQ